MVVVAVAGGTGGVGKTIVNELLSHPSHLVYVLGRRNPEKSSQDVKFIEVDYQDVASLTRVLEKNNIEVVISTINLQNDAASNAQLNLIEASKRSGTAKRFIPSEFAFVTSPGDAEAEPSVAFALKSLAALKESGLEFTRFANGFFMDYWGLPHIPSNLWAYTWAIDVANKQAAIPGSGNDVLSLTYSVDVAKFIVRLLSELSWPQQVVLSGSDITFNELLAIAERVRGSEFNVKYDSLEQLEKNEPTLLQAGYGGGSGASEDEAKQMVSIFGRLTISGNFRLPTEGRINEKFPELHVTTAEELLTRAWAGK